MTGDNIRGNRLHDIWRDHMAIIKQFAPGLVAIATYGDTPVAVACFAPDYPTADNDKIFTIRHPDCF